MAERGAAPLPCLAAVELLGRWMGRLSFPTCSPSICQIDPVPKPSTGRLLLQTHRSPGTELLAPEAPPDPGAERGTAAS